MRKITALAALLALSLAGSTAHAGDRSSLEPQSRSGPSFIPNGLFGKDITWQLRIERA